MTVPVRGVPNDTQGVDFVDARDGGLVAVGPDGVVYRIVGYAGAWRVYRLSAYIEARVLWVAWTRRGAVRALVGFYRARLLSVRLSSVTVRP